MIGQHKGITDDQIKNALARAGGISVDAAAELGCNSENVRRRARRLGLYYNQDTQIKQRKFTDAEIDDAFVAAGGSQRGAAKLLGLNGASVNKRIRRINAYSPLCIKQSVYLEVPDGVVLIGSDAHIWPGLVTTAMSAFSYFVADMQPQAVILNGDVIDGAAVSRHPRHHGQRPPKVHEEIKAAQEYLAELVEVSPHAEHVWPMGNHDERYEEYLRSRTNDELIELPFSELKEYFKAWTPCFATWINVGLGHTPVKVIHHERGGNHATYNNTLHSGVHVVTGHLHNLKATPHNDEWGIRWGVDSGMLAAPPCPGALGPSTTGIQFSYLKGRTVNWRSGFVVLTFRDGKMQMPELVHVTDEAEGLVEFRGEILHV